MQIRVVYPSPDYPKLRRWPRYSVDLPVRIYSDAPGGAEEGRGTSLNLGGMAISTTVGLEVGDEITIEFIPPKADQPVTARCVVCNSTSGAYGVEFIAENEADLRTISEIEYGLSSLDTAVQ